MCKNHRDFFNLTTIPGCPKRPKIGCVCVNKKINKYIYIYINIIIYIMYIYIYIHPWLILYNNHCQAFDHLHPLGFPVLQHHKRHGQWYQLTMKTHLGNPMGGWGVTRECPTKLMNALGIPGWISYIISPQKYGHANLNTYIYKRL